jgi:hypothetical protein
MQMELSSVRRVVSLAAVLAVLAGTAAAQAQSSVEGSFDQPLKGQAGKSTVRGLTTIKENDDDHSYSVKIEGDKVTAEVDGKELPAKRVRQRNGRVELLDEDGGVMKSFNIRTFAATTPFAGPRMRVETIQPGAQGGGFGGPQVWTPSEPPKVMMGVTMSDAEDGGVQIETVIDELPAQKAGVKVGDRIVKANGKEVDNQQELREIIRGAEPGDTLTLVVDRDGKETQLKVKLTKWDQKLLPTTPMVPDVFTQLHAAGDENLEKAREQLRAALDQIKNEKRLEGRNLDRVRESLEKVLKSLEDVKAHSMLNWNADDHLKIYGQGRGQNFLVPAQSDDLARQLERMNAQMEKLNKRLDELENNRR